MAATMAALRWAEEEYGHARLGNRLRTRRLVTMAAGLADGPTGLLAAAFQSVRERVGAYRFVENRHIQSEAVLASSAEATLQRAEGEAWVYVPIDGSSLSLADPVGRRRLGAVGPYKLKGRGLKTMTSLAVRRDGTLLGLLDLQWWARAVRPDRKASRNKRPIADKETRYWLQAVERVEAAFHRTRTTVQPWFQLDREGDFREMLALMSEMTTARMTVRAAHNRRTAQGDCGYLWDQLRAQAPGGRYGLTVSAGRGRAARTAHMVVRWAPITFLLRNRQHNSGDRRTEAGLWAVLALEEGTVPKGEKPLQWLLLTNVPVHDLADAAEVLYGYTQRWRVEDFHRAWKSQCDVESTQLHDVEHIQCWATILAAVATRIERLKVLARTEPELPANVELTQAEIDAIIVLRRPAGYRPGDGPSIGQAVRWIADIGGYIGPSHGPPGSTVIGRGLQRVQTAVLTLHNLARVKPD